MKRAITPEILILQPREGPDMKVRFCENNEGSGAVYKRLKADFPEQSIKRKNCVKCCSSCNITLFAVVEGNPLRGKNSEDMYQKIAALLKKDTGTAAE
jgi:uncharacterized protein YuzB (UPF0349 family)